MRASLLASVACLASGIVRRSDVSDSEYRTEALPQVVMVNPSLFSAKRSATDFNVECGGTMISKKHVVTAAHCFEGITARKKGFTVEVNGKSLKAADTHFNPSCKFSDILDGPNRCDVAVIELDGEADVEAFPVYQWDDEEGKHMDIYGWGVTGRADRITANTCSEGDEDGHFRHAENTVSEATSNVLGGGLLKYTMSKNKASDTLPLEGISASGDSGSPLLLLGPDGRRYIAGTNSGSNDDNGCKYGATDQYCRLSRHYDWIQSVIGGPAPPAPSPEPTPSPAPTPEPTPAPAPEGCPGGSLKACIALCPPQPDEVYTACVENCGEKCAGSLLVA